MWKSAAAMLAGVMGVLVLPELPAPMLLVALAVPLACAALYRPRWRWLLLLPLGALWCGYAADVHLSTRLDTRFEAQDLTLTGWVSSLPEQKGGLTEFEFCVESLDGHLPGQGVPARVRLSIEDGSVLPRAGEHWSLGVRLRRPRGFMDPGAFDYEGWLFFHGIGATGYVAHGASLLPGTRYPLLRLRAALRERIGMALAGDPFSGMVTALVVGDLEQGDHSSSLILYLYHPWATCTSLSTCKHVVYLSIIDSFRH